MFATAALHETVLDTPLLGRRVLAAVRLAGVPLQSWSGQRLLDVISRHPRDELFWATPEDLHETAVGVLGLAQGRRLRLSLRREPYGRFFSCLVHLPHDRYSPPARVAMQRVLLRELDGWRIDHTAGLGEPGPVLVHFTVQVDPTAPAPDHDRLHRQLAAAILTWDDWVLDAAGPDADGIAGYLAGLPQGYKDDVDPVRALADLRRIRDLGDEPYLELSRRGGRPRRRAAFPAAAGRRGGLAVGGASGAAQPGRRGARRAALRDHPAGRELVLDLRLRARCRPGDRGQHGRAQRQETQDRFCAAFRAAWTGAAATDRFNALVLQAGLDWREVALLRAYAHYAAQLGGPFGREYVAEILLAHPAAARALVELFRARFDPAPEPAERTAARTRRRPRRAG